MHRASGFGRLSSRTRGSVWALGLLWAALFAASLGCGSKKEALEPRFVTWAELRVVRLGVKVTPPGEQERAPFPRERLADGASVTVASGGLAWLRRDGGATLLVRGPAKLVLRARSIDVEAGRVFVDTPPGATIELTTPSGPLTLAQVRSSLDVAPDAPTRAYVLAGEVKAAGTRAGAGELMTLSGTPGSPKATVAPELVWEDWTGGLATTDRAAAPAPFGVGTVGARPPGEQGSPRFPLAIQRMDVRVKIEGDFALTEVDQTFFNPSSKTVEGMYGFRTPERAILHRFGVDREGVIVWGRVKEKAAAAAQYQKNVYQGSTEDPALLEWDAPGAYRARLYPIGPGESRRVVVRYGEWLNRAGEKAERRLYVFPMAAEGSDESLPRIEELKVLFDLTKAGTKEARIGMAGVRDGDAIVVRAQDHVPRADLALELFDDGPGELRALKAPHVPDYEALPPADREAAEKAAREEADYVLVPVRAEQAPLAAGGLDLVIVIDSSAATDPGALSIARSATAALLAQLGEADRAVVWAGADGVRPVVPEWPTLAKVDEAARRKVLTALATLDRGGATDLGAMIAAAAGALDPARRGAVVYVGDALPTVGELNLKDLRTRLDKLPRPVRIFGLGVGDSANLALLEGVARGAFAERIGDAHQSARAALRVLETAERPAWLGTAVDLGANVERVYPRDTSTLVPDETLLVIGRLVQKKEPQALKLTGPAGNREIPLELATFDDRGDLRRRWAEQRLAQMVDDGEGRAAMVDLGTRNGIVTPVTSFYVPTKNEMSGKELEEFEKKLEARRSRGPRGGTEQTAMHVVSLKAAAERDEDAEEEVASARADNKEGGTGTRAKGEEGSMGNPSSKGASKRYAVQGPKDNDPKAPPAAREAQEFGMIGLLNQGAGGESPPAAGVVPAPAAAEPPIEKSAAPAAAASAARSTTDAPADGKSARGNMWGDQIGEAFGAGGLGLSSAGEGGGGKSDGIGLGSVGTLGKGAGTGTGQGFGSGHGRLGGSHRTAAPTVRMGAVAVAGSLPPEVIQRIVRQNYGRFRMCYEQGLGRNPNLEGRVSVRFVIGGDGAVTTASNGGSDLPDSGVVGCVVSAFNGLSFPQPEMGVVTVTYPVMFSPGGGGPLPAPATPVVAITIKLGDLPRWMIRCSAAANMALEERVALWRERLSAAGHPDGGARVYRSALANCEAPTWRERSRLLSLLLDSMPTVANKVELWRKMGDDFGAADALYRGILARVRTPAQMRELHAALGLKSFDPGLLRKLIQDAKSHAELVIKLRALAPVWPDDFNLALALLDALEDAEDRAGARELARTLRARPDADARVRTAVGELYLRLAARAGSPVEKAADTAEARRAFGEIVEFAPDDPVARRRLGDLLRSHGWFAEAQRQYETLARLVPDDASVALLLGSAAEGRGMLEEALKWSEKGGAAGAPGTPGATTARALGATWLAWGRQAARQASKTAELKALSARAERVLSGLRTAPGKSARVTLSWSHPELHPTLWSNALGSAMPAPEGDVTLGIAQVMLPERDGAFVEVRIEPNEVDHAARLGAEAILTVVFDEIGAGEKIVRVPVRFERAGPATLKFVISGREARRE